MNAPSENPFDKHALSSAEPLFSLTSNVPFQHVDAAGIVFFARVLEYFHDSYVAFLVERGQPLHRAIAERQWAAPLVNVEADFFRPLRFGDTISVGLVRARWDRQQLTVGYRVTNSDGATTAVGHTVHAFVDPTTFRRADPPEAVKAALAELTAR